MDRIVLGHPYEGGFYHLLNGHLNKYPGFGRGYYGTLYGPNPIAEQVHAANLAALSEEIILPGDDIGLPDKQRYLTGDNYYNPDLRLRSDWSQKAWDFKNAALKIASQLIYDPELARICRGIALGVDQTFAEFVVHGTIVQLSLALKHDATLVVGEAGAALVDRVFELVHHEIAEMSPSQEPQLLILTPRSLRLVGLGWQCESLEAFTDVRRSAQITEYSAGFRNAVKNAMNSDDLERELLRQMKMAMDSADVARKAKAAFETTGIVSDIVGAIPVAGTVATIVGLKSYLAEKAAERHETRNEWFRIGPKMSEVSLESVLKKATS